jgi:predicted HTH transcriptional regulator
MAINLEGILRELLKHDRECEWIEFKQNNSDPAEIGEYGSALANSAALCGELFGYLVFGIEDSTFAAVGTTFQPKNTKIGNQELENWVATQLEPQIDFGIYQFSYQGKSLVLFRFDAARHRPVAFRGKEFIRVGSYKKSLKDHPEKERKLWSVVSAASFESGIARDGIDSDTILKLIDYPQYFDLIGMPLPSNKEGIIRTLEEESMIQCAADGSPAVTNLGAILFARNLAEFSGLYRKAVRVVVYKGKDRLHALKEHEGAYGYAAGFSRLIGYINDQLPIDEQIGQALRHEVRRYPEIVVRELVANMLIHQDFSIPGSGPMVEIFEDRIELSNPGRPLIDTLRFMDHSPRSRNEKLAYLMRRIKVCEERGSGIDKVVAAVELYQLPAPAFQTEDGYFRVTLSGPKSLRQMNKDDKVRACYQHCCLKRVSGSAMTNETLRGRFKIDEKNYSIASRIIGETIESGLVRPSDPTSKSKKLASYVPFWA